MNWNFRWSLAVVLLWVVFTGSAFAEQIEKILIQPIPLSPGTPVLPAQPAQSVPLSIEGQQPALPELRPRPAQPQPEGQSEPSMLKEGKPQEALSGAPQPSGGKPLEVAPLVSGEKLSEFERYISGKVPLTVSTDIKQFGYELFMQAPSTFTPIDKVPVGPDYVLGPGDEIKITIWGKIEGSWAVEVDRDGNISLPKVGVLGVTGLTFKELKELLHKEFSRYFTGYQMSVSMGSLRTIRVYVVGSTQHPGAYTLSSFSTLINALFEAGGPSKAGTMRDIQLKRNGKTIVHFDMYDLFLKGDKTKDIRLMPEDVVFIPPVGQLAGIAGNVKRPAIYELKGEIGIAELIAMAGGITATGYLQRVQAERVFDNEVKVIVDTNLKKLEKQDDIILKDGDIVKVFPIADVVVNAVELKGNVPRQGRYQWFEGMRVSDIIKDPEKDILPETYFEHALIERYVPPDYHKEITSFNLGRAIFDKDENEDKLLQPYDTLTIYSKWEFLDKPVVMVSGAVNRPGKFELSPNMKISDLLNLAGGQLYYASNQAELTRVRVTQEGPRTSRVIINLSKAMEGDPEHNITLTENDYLFVRTVPEWKLYQTVSIQGEVKFPGVYTIKRGERLSSLIERAGGFTGNAYLRGAVFTREMVRQLQRKRLDEMVERLERELLGTGAAEAAVALTSEEAKIKEYETTLRRDLIEKMKEITVDGRMTIVLNKPKLLRGTIYDIELEEGDSVFVPSNPNSVQVIGSVYNQTAFVYDNNKRVSDYVELAGGYTENANKGKVYVLGADGTAVSLKSSSRLNPGDTIVVPEKIEKVAWMRDIKDITQILYQIAVTAGVLIVLF